MPRQVWALLLALQGVQPARPLTTAPRVWQPLRVRRPRAAAPMMFWEKLQQLLGEPDMSPQSAEVLVSTIEVLRVEVQAKAAEVESISAELATMKAAVEDLESDYAIEGRALEKEQTYASQLDELRTLQAEVLRSLEGALEQSEAARVSLSARRQERFESLVQLQSEAGALSQALDAANGTLSSSEEAAAGFAAQQADESALARIAELQTEVGSLGDALEAANRREANLTTQLAIVADPSMQASESREVALARLLRRAERQVGGLEAQLLLVSDRIVVLQRERDGLVGERADLTASLAATTSRLVASEAREAAFAARPALGLLAYGLARDASAVGRRVRRELFDAPRTPYARAVGVGMQRVGAISVWLWTLFARPCRAWLAAIGGGVRRLPRVGRALAAAVLAAAVGGLYAAIVYPATACAASGFYAWRGLSAAAAAAPKVQAPSALAAISLTAALAAALRAFTAPSESGGDSVAMMALEGSAALRGTVVPTRSPMGAAGARGRSTAWRRISLPWARHGAKAH